MEAAESREAKVATQVLQVTHDDFQPACGASTGSVGMTYRTLEHGEIIGTHDETDRSSDPWRDPVKWEPVHPNNVGDKAPDPKCPAHRIFRRPTTPLNWEFDHTGEWRAYSSVGEDDWTYEWVIGVCDDGTFDVSQSDAELTSRKECFATLKEAKRFCEDLDARLVIDWKAEAEKVAET